MATGTQPKTTTKTITLPTKLYLALNDKAKEVGLTFNEYVRHLAVNIVEGDTEDLPVIYDKKTVKQVLAVREAYEKGEYTVFDPKDKKQLRKALPLK